jgi:hypothetical protein
MALEPIFLSDEIIALARLWRDGCLARWDSVGDGQPLVIGRACFASPVDGATRKALLSLGSVPWIVSFRQACMNPRGRSARVAVLVLEGRDGWTCAK